MKNMKSKLVALMLVIPLLLIFTTSSVVKITTILVDVPVSSVEIMGESSLSVDIAAENNTVQLITAVYPENATNKKISYIAEAVDGQPEAKVLISDGGLVTPLSTGVVKITAFASDRSASIQIVFFSTAVLGTVQLTHSFNLNESDVYILKDGRDFSISPNGIAYSINWSSSNDTVASVDAVSGKINAHRGGKVKIVGTVRGLFIDDVTGKVSEREYTLSYDVSVGVVATETGISFGGNVTATKPTLNSVKFDFSYDKDMIAAYGGLNLDYDNDIFENVQLSYNDGYGTISASLREDTVEGETYQIGICAADNSLITSVYVIKAVMTSAYISLDKTAYKVSRTEQEFQIGLSSDATSSLSYTVSFTSNNPSVLSVQTINNVCYATPRSEGSATVSAIVYRRGTNTVVDVEIEPVVITVYNPYSTLSLDDNSKSFGLEREFAFGKFRIVDGKQSVDAYHLTLKGMTADGTQTKVIPNELNEKLIWESDNENIAVVENGVVTLGNTSGIVTISVKSAYNDIFKENIYASFKINCRADAVNVNNYEELMFCSKNNLACVLMEDVMLAPLLSDKNFTGYKSYLQNECTFTLKTTADNSYYVNNNAEKDSYIRYCVEFTNDVFGNGHWIDANNITRSQSLYGFSVFNGPLDLVRLKYDNTSSQNAAVKAQDNIVFLVRKNNISLRNIELKGCSDSVVNGDLGNLDNCGTVLEIVGDDCSVNYSRVNNGRTVVRIFGKPATNSAAVASNPSDYRITADISNCILSYGREFLLKIGSNQIKKNPSVTNGPMLNAVNYTPLNNKALYDDASPYLTKQNGDNYSVGDEKDDYFYNNYVMTDLTLRDSVLYNAGLFCIGFESIFGGLCLHGYDYSDSYRFGSSLGWGNIAGTSYPAVLNMEGDVRFYDWKKISNVNSDTLIEGNSQILNLVGLNMNVSSLIDSYNGDNADKLTVTSGGEKYVNGAIAFYGGGKNYSYVTTDGVSSSFYPLTEFSIPLSYFGSRVNLIYYSAGAENFRFLLYDKNCALNISKQTADLSDNTAFLWIYKK